MTHLRINHNHARSYSRFHTVTHRPLKFLSILFLAVAVTGCMSSAPLQLQNHFPMEEKASEVFMAKLAQTSGQKIPVGMVIVHQPESYDFPLESKETWMKFAGRIKSHFEGISSMEMEKVMMVNNLNSEEALSRIRQFGRDEQYDSVMVVFPSGNEVEASARYDLLPEVSMMIGRQIDHYATIELGLLDIQSGKLLMQVQGHSFATLDKLDTPIESNRYPRVQGSAMTSYIYPDEAQAFETLRAVALDEALEQATMKLQEKWPTTS